MKVPKYILDNTEGIIQASQSFYLNSVLYGNYDIRVVIVSNLGYAKECCLGRGSMLAFMRVKQYLLNKNIAPILEVGRMGQFADESEIIVDGEHANDEILNVDFNMFPVAKSRLLNNNKIVNNLRAKGKTVIGSGVVLSRRCMVLSGAKIGNGAVVGAGAVVAKDVPAYSIVAGNPARVIKYRFDEKTIEKLEEIRWWDFDFDYLFENVHAIQQMSTSEFIEKFGDVSKNKYHTSKDRFVFDNKGPMGKCIGCDLDGEFVLYDDLNESIKFYIDQGSRAENSDIYIVRNILDCRE